MANHLGCRKIHRTPGAARAFGDLSTETQSQVLELRVTASDAGAGRRSSVLSITHYTFNISFFLETQAERAGIFKPSRRFLWQFRMWAAKQQLLLNESKISLDLYR